MSTPRLHRRDFLAVAAAGTAGTVTANDTAGPPIGIWDLHGHIMPVPGLCRRTAARLPANSTPRPTPEQLAASIADCAERMGVERQVLFMGMDQATADPTPEQIRRDNDECMRAVATRPDRLFGFVYLSLSHPTFSLGELDRCVRNGPFLGVKLWGAQRCNVPAMDPVVRRAAELGALVYQHTWLKTTGNSPGESTPHDLVEAAARHPKVPLVCGHAGGNWELAIRIVRPYPNVLLETAGNDPAAGMIEMAVRELGAERIVYGSDIGGRSYSSQIAKVSAAGIDRRSKELILRENLRRLLGPILRTKGIRA